MKSVCGLIWTQESCGFQENRRFCLVSKERQNPHFQETIDVGMVLVPEGILNTGSALQHMALGIIEL